MEYVVGFMMSQNYIALIRKTKPAYQTGKLNGIGGKIEPGESPTQAMIREFKEEAGLPTKPIDWYHFCTLKGENEYGDKTRDAFVVYFFFSLVDDITLWLLKTKTDEEVRVEQLDQLETLPVMPNIRWMVPMIQSFEKGEHCERFTVIEENNRKHESS